MVCKRQLSPAKSHSDVEELHQTACKLEIIFHPGFSQAHKLECKCAKSFPSEEKTEVGKSSLLTALTGVQSEAAAYEFTTLTCIPGWNIYGGISSRIEIKQLVLYGHAMPCLRLRYTAFPKSAIYLHHSLCNMFPLWTYDLSLSLDA